MSRAPTVFPALAAALALLTICVSLLPATEAGCYLERGVTNPGEHDAYTCLRSKDFRADLERLPLNKTKLVNVAFRDGKVPKIEADHLQKLGTKALGISVVHCGLEDVDAEAFHGLTELKALILRRNRLSSVKKEWFKDLAKLESLDLSGNKIRKFESSVFDLTPLIQEFEISENRLTRFDVDVMKTKWPKLKKVGLQWNPYELCQGVKIIDYSNAHPNIVKNSYVSIDGIRDTAIIVKECQNTITDKVDSSELTNCVQAKLNKAIDNPKILEGENPLAKTAH